MRLALVAGILPTSKSLSATSGGPTTSPRPRVPLDATSRESLPVSAHSVPLDRYLRSQAALLDWHVVQEMHRLLQRKLEARVAEGFLLLLHEPPDALKAGL